MRWDIVLVILLLIPISVPVIDPTGGNDKLTPFARVNHAPISINGNSDLQSKASSEGWTGSGALNDPYIITNYRISTTSAYCISVRNIDLHLVISDNNLTSSDTAGIGLYNVQNARITDNLVALNNKDGILLEDSVNIRVDNNTLDMELVLVMNYNGIHLVRSDENYIENNRIDLSENDAIRVEDGSNYNLLSGNIIVENRNNGINLESDDNTVFRNKLISNKVGVMVDASRCLIIENKMKLNSHGVVLHSMGNNIVRNNNFDRNNFGVKVFISDDNQIYSNYIMKSDLFGIDIEHSSASGNIIYDNSLFYNNGTGSYYIASRRQARDISGDNIWNSPYNKGNYWYDFRSPDSDSDGIVDNWYFIDGGEEWDYFPLVDSLIPDVFTPPKKLTPQPGNDHINLTWWPVNYGKGILVTHFNIYKNEREGGEFFLDKVPANKLSYTDWDVVPGRSYYYYMTAVTEIAESNRSNRVKSSPDTKRPTIDIRSPDDGSVHNSTNIYIDWIGNDNIAIDRYEITLDDEPPLNIELSEFYMFLNLLEGEHSVEVRIFDMAEHNISDITTFTIDTKPPVLSIHGSDDAPLLFLTDIPTVTWTGEDIGPGIDGYHISTDGVNWTWIGNVEEYTFNYRLNEGKHTIHIKCVDIAGNWVNDTIDIIVDLTEPLLYFLQPLGPGYYSTDRIDIRYNASDDLTNVTEYLVRIDTNRWISKGLTRTHTFRDLDEGQHHLYVKAKDGAGNEIIASQTGTIDHTPPEVEILNLKDGALYNAPVTFEWNTWDLISGVEMSRLSVDGDEWRTFTIPKPVEIGFPRDGDHYLVLEIFDKAGNSISVNISFSFDVSSPMVTTAEPRGSDVPVNSRIVVTFSEPMNRETVLIDAPEIDGELIWIGDNLTLVPSEPLKHSKKYSIALSGMDIAGNRLISYDWFFLTEEDLSLHYGRVFGRVVTTDGYPIPFASYRFKTGEKGNCDEEGGFDTYVTTGKNFLIISNKSFHDTKVEFEIYEGEQEDLGNIPLKSEKEDIDNTEQGSSSLYVIIGIVTFILVALVIGAVVAIQIKKTRDYHKMGPVVDEWVNFTDIKKPSSAPKMQPPVAQRVLSEESIQR